MTIELAGFLAIIAIVSSGAGLLGSLTGLGGGIIIIPFLTLALGIDIRYAIGASLVSVIATSSGAAAAYVREGFTNIRVAMFLEIATVSGALSGTAAAALLPPAAIAVLFGAVLLYSSYATVTGKKEEGAAAGPDRLASLLGMDGSYPLDGSEQSYHVRAVPAGMGLMALAGILSALLGIGSGALKVIAMDRFMKMPYKASAATSNFMIGVTAAASAGVYLHRGYIDPVLSLPVMLGVLAGSFAGSRILTRARTRVLRAVFAAAIALAGLEMICKGIAGRF
ncbi:MAG TPA: sulfite exporter TauE/SafE family protein [Chitinivibrionales bacterium]|nr:sulfite exporter TauE/SafE family protein [Chitinivibrionales bacterium]